MKAYTINTEFDASDKYIVDNIIARKSITLIVASPKKGKTAIGLNLGTCINEGIDFLENKVRKTKVVYYCNELSGRLIQERIKRLELPCSSTMKFYEGTGYVDFGEFERIIKSDVDLGYEVFVVDTFSKIKYDRKYNANDYNDIGGRGVAQVIVQAQGVLVEREGLLGGQDVPQVGVAGDDAVTNLFISPVSMLFKT